MSSSYISRWFVQRILLVTLIAGTISGCSTVENGDTIPSTKEGLSKRNRISYKGPARPISELAYLKIEKPICVTVVDGKTLFGYLNTTELDILPGKKNISALYATSSQYGATSSSATSLDFVAEKTKRYLVDFKVFGRHQLLVWVEEIRDGEKNRFVSSNILKLQAKMEKQIGKPVDMREVIDKLPPPNGRIPTDSGPLGDVVDAVLGLR